MTTPEPGWDPDAWCEACGYAHRANDDCVATPTPAEPGLREALEQAYDRMEAMWEHMKPDQTDDDRHAIAQNCWFGMEEARKALGEP